MDINTIKLGDAYELIKQVPDKSVDLIVTDPPYQFNGYGGCSGLLKNREHTYCEEIKESGIENGFDLKFLEEFVRVMKKINIYLWCNKEQIYDYLTFFVKERGCNWEMIVWSKANPAPYCSTHYLKDKEYCLYFWETGVKPTISYERGNTVYFSNINKADKDKYNHPTIKPEEIIENLIRNSCAEGLVFDPFSGSGTTCVVAKRLGLDYLGFEINPKYHAISVDRLEGITAKDRKQGHTQLKLF